ncbi:hypothetical protein FOZ63_000442, partial [Perkinsus olseni]
PTISDLKQMAASHSNLPSAEEKDKVFVLAVTEQAFMNMFDLFDKLRGFCYRHRHRGGNSPSVDQQSDVLRRSTPGYSSANTNYTVPLTEPLIKIESLLSRIIEQLVREVVDGSAQDENANGDFLGLGLSLSDRHLHKPGLHAQGNMNAAFILKNHSSLRRDIGQLPGGSQACRDLNDLVYLLQISFTGDYGYLLFELDWLMK